MEVLTDVAKEEQLKTVDDAIQVSLAVVSLAVVSLATVTASCFMERPTHTMKYRAGATTNC